MAGSTVGNGNGEEVTTLEVGDTDGKTVGDKVEDSLQVNRVGVASKSKICAGPVTATEDVQELALFMFYRYFSRSAKRFILFQKR